jgi:DNA-directed RNA polymerase subunit alpha
MNHNISLPSKPRIVKEDENKGTYEIENLYSGYGYTLGNSLRRIILSSLPGAAITVVKIDGASHEFSVLSGVKEVVINIILNLKRIRFKMHTSEPQKISLSIKGAKTVTATDIKTSSEIEILNKDQFIATLTSKSSKLDIEITVEKGLGYALRETLHKTKTEVGTILLDAMFSPIRRVNYEVENMRVGDRTDYNKLRFTIETDGSITAHQALEDSIAIMINHLRAIVGFKETEVIVEKSAAPEEEESAKKSEETGGEDTEVLKTRVEDLQLSSRTLNSLSAARIRTVGGLARKKETDLLEVEGIGKTAVQEIRRALGNFGLVIK